MKKIILLLIIFFLCGCEAEYTLSINNDKTYNQLLIVKEPNMMKGDEYYFTFNGGYKYFLEKYPDTIFSSKFIGETYQTLVEQNNLKLDNISTNLKKYSEIIESSTYNYLGNKKTLNVILSDQIFDKFKLEKLTLYIKTPYEVESYGTAEKVSDMLYKYNLDKNQKEINFVFYQNEDILDIEDKTSNTLKIIIISLLGVLALLGIGILIYLSVKNQGDSQ